MRNAPGLVICLVTHHTNKIVENYQKYVLGTSVEDVRRDYDTSYRTQSGCTITIKEILITDEAFKAMATCQYGKELKFEQKQIQQNTEKLDDEYTRRNKIGIFTKQFNSTIIRPEDF